MFDSDGDKLERALELIIDKWIGKLDTLIRTLVEDGYLR
jgi:hypothetical protein